MSQRITIDAHLTFFMWDANGGFTGGDYSDAACPVEKLAPAIKVAVDYFQRQVDATGGYGVVIVSLSDKEVNRSYPPIHIRATKRIVLPHEGDHN